MTLTHKSHKIGTVKGADLEHNNYQNWQEKPQISVYWLLHKFIKI
jgi:hypothetical protein